LRGVFFDQVILAKVGSMKAVVYFVLIALAGHSAMAAPQNYLFTHSGDLAGTEPLLRRPDIAGVQIVYSWKSLESARDTYDFSQIERDLAFVEKLNRRLFIQIQDRFFEIGHRNVPKYLLEDPQFGGGLVPQVDNPGENKPEGHGWVAQQWNPEVRKRYQKLLGALARQFDGRVAGVNLPETAVGVDIERDKTGFTCEGYFDAELENIAFARKAFAKSHVVLYANFWPCEWDDEKKFMSRTFAFAQENGIGLGGPDIVPYKKAQMKNSYPFFNRYKGKLSLVAMAVQPPTLTYTNPETKKPFTREEFVAFAEDYLGVNIIFWTTESPWLRQGR
jgi:hypothetical protein